MATSAPCMLFDKSAETVTEFIERFELQCSELLHKARNNDRRQVILIMKALPVAVFTDVQRSLSPKSVSDASFLEVKNILINLYSTKKSALGSSVQFFNCKQKPGQSVDEYAREIKYYSQQCGFEAQVSLSRIQRDVFLSGLSSKPVITSMLQTSENLTFEEAITKAKLFTQIREDTSMLSNNAPVHSVEEMSFPSDVNRAVISSIPSNYVCIRCGEKGKHKASECYALKIKCNLCSKPGHMARVCRSAKRDLPRKLNHMDVETEESTGNFPQEDECHMLHFREPANSRNVHLAQARNPRAKRTNHRARESSTRNTPPRQANHRAQQSSSSLAPLRHSTHQVTDKSLSSSARTTSSSPLRTNNDTLTQSLDIDVDHFLF